MTYILLRRLQSRYMSFFYLRKWFEKYVAEVKTVWMCAALIAAGCVFLSVMDQPGQSGEQYTYHLDYEGNEEVLSTEGGVNALSKLNARYALLMDAANGRVLYEKNGYEQAPMASTTKIMTLLVALENGSMDDMVTVSAYAAKMPKVHLGMKANEQYRLKDLLYSLMLESHNDTAVAIAEHIGGSVEGFALMMNNKAKELGAYHTNFVTPNGLDAEEHYTTAYDLALITSYAIQNEAFLEIVNTPSYSFYEQTTQRGFTVNNKDRFLNTYSGAIGVKTGFTGNAGYCFVGAARREGKQLVSVVLACGWPPNKTYKWKDTTALMNYGMDNFSEKEILAAGTSFQQIPVTDSIEGGPVIPYVKEGVSLLLKEGETVDFDIQLPRELRAPVKEDDTLGKITISINGAVHKVLPLYANEARTRITYEYVLWQVVRKYLNAG